VHTPEHISIYNLLQYTLQHREDDTHTHSSGGSVGVYVYTHICIHTHLNTHTLRHKRARTHTHARTHARTHTHTGTHTHTHTHTHMYAGTATLMQPSYAVQMRYNSPDPNYSKVRPTYTYTNELSNVVPRVNIHVNFPIPPKPESHMNIRTNLPLASYL